MSAAVAAFDWDGTLTVRDCVRPFLERVGGRAGMAKALVRHPLETFGASLHRDRDRAKVLLVGGVLAGRDVSAVEALGESFAAEVFDGWLRADVVARMRWHQRAGHRVVVDSASLGTYLRPLGRRLAVDAVLCTEPQRAGARYTAGLEGANCRAAEKVRRLERWLADEGLVDATVWAYGDSTGDRELLARADHALNVRGVTVASAPAECAA